MAEVQTGTRIDDRYIVRDRIGSGGMADVYCADDTQLGRQVALKLLHRRFAADQQFVERFRREAQSAAGLQHPNVVGVYDRGEWDGTGYIAMEYLPGRNLKELIDAEAPIAPVRAIDLTIQVLKAARFAHKRGIIHRDFKPHNVIVDDEDRVKVTDFGIARAGASDMTETGSIMGTAQYLSPEQAQGRAVSAQSDVYSIGVILYELLTGRVPFEGDTAVSVALQHVSEPPPAPRTVVASVPAELDTLVVWALEKDPKRRPASAETFLQALEQTRAHIAAGGPGEETTNFMPVPVPPPVGNGEPGPTGATVAPVAYPVEPDPEAELEEEDRRNRRRLLLGALLVLLLIGGGIAAFLLTRPAKAAVPELVGDTLEVASTRLQNDGFQVDTILRTSSKPRDQVIGQNPLAGEQREVGSTVTLTVSSGPGQAVVPDVAGETEAVAGRRLRRLGFEVRSETEPSDTVGKGLVIGTSPDRGTEIDKGRTVTLTVSSGPPLVAVPPVVGQDENSATAELSGAGFEVQVSREESASEETGTVLSQDPGANTSVQAGSTVTIVVAEQAEVTIPNVVGLNSDKAVNTLQGAGFATSIDTQKVNSPDDDGIVISQSPGAGSTAADGDSITIVVGSFAPDLQGEAGTQTDPEAVPPEDPSAPADPSGGGTVEGGGTTVP